MNRLLFYHTLSVPDPIDPTLCLAFWFGSELAPFFLLEYSTCVLLYLVRAEDALLACLVLLSYCVCLSQSL